MLRAVSVIGAASFVLAVGAPVRGPQGRDIGPAHPAAAAASAARHSVIRTPQVVVYAAPLPPPLRVLRGFSPPLTAYGPGHLGVDLDPGSTLIVAAAADGRVTFAGPVAGRGVVVIAHADGVRTEYEPLRPLVRTGQPVRRGEAIGRLFGSHRGCAVTCLHWGARRGDTYLDPLGLLHRLGPVRLLPWP